MHAALEPLKILTHNDPPMWLKSDLIKMMELLVNVAFGVIKYNTACQELGKSVVHSLIQYNLVHMSPTSHLSFDVPSQNCLLP